jgi:hypothetical protein
VRIYRTSPSPVYIVAMFCAAHPDITLDVRSTHALANLALPTFDLAIRDGQGRWPGVKSQLLFEVQSAGSSWTSTCTRFSSRWMDKESRLCPLRASSG